MDDQTPSSATWLKSSLPVIENRMHNNDMPKQPCKEEIIERIVGFFRHQIMDHCQCEFFYKFRLEVEMSMMKFEHSEANVNYSPSLHSGGGYGGSRTMPFYLYVMCTISFTQA